MVADQIFQVEPPDYDPATHALRAGDVVEIDGMWCQQWILEPLALPTKPELFARLQSRLTEVEDGGALWQGVPVASTEAVLRRLAGELAAGEAGHGAREETFSFVRDDGVPMLIDRAALQSIVGAVAEHRAKAGAAHDAILDAIEAGIVRTLADVAGHPDWPLNP